MYGSRFKETLEKYDAANVWASSRRSSIWSYIVSCGDISMGPCSCIWANLPGFCKYRRGTKLHKSGNGGRNEARLKNDQR